VAAAVATTTIELPGRDNCKRDSPRRSLVRAHRRAALPAGARARARGEGEPAARGRVRREPDAPGRRARAGARPRPDEPARAALLRRTGARAARGRADR